MTRLLLLSLILAMSTSAFAAEEPVKFMAEPKCVVEKDGVRIDFAVNRATDLAVEILDEKGDAVRHLAAGVLGDNAPEPLKKNSLAQSLLWDRKDDLGKDAPPGDYSVRVALGLSPHLKKLENYEPLNAGAVFGLAAMSEGGVCVFNRGGYPDFLPRLVVADRQGAYVRQVFPPPANLKPEDSGLKGFRRGDGRWVPMLSGVLPVSGPSVALAAHGVTVYVCADNAIRAVNAKTGAVSAPLADSVIGLGKGRIAARALAVSPDGKQLYLTGVEVNPKDDKASRALHAVYRMPADGSQAPKPLVGDPDKADKTNDRLNAPVGLAVDKDGSLLVCDSANDRLAVFSPDGKFVRSVDVKSPLFVAAHPQGGAVTLCAAASPGASRKFAATGLRLVRLDADGREAATEPVAIPPQVPKAWLTGMALDAAKEPAIVSLSLGGESWPMTAGALARYECAATAFKALPPVSTNFRKTHTKGPYDARYLYNWGILDPSYPKYREALDWHYLPDEGSAFYSPGPDDKGLWADGRTYLWNDTIWYHKKKADAAVSFLRFGPNRVPLPFEAFKTNALKLDYEPNAPWFAQRGTMVDRRGHVYVRYTFTHPAAKEQGLGDRNQWCTGILHYDSDGRKVGEIVLTHGTYGMGVDARGNIYVGDKPRPAGALVPEDVEKAFDGKVPPDIAAWYGSVIKFGPAGGRFIFKNGAPAESEPRRRGDLFKPPLKTMDADFNPSTGGRSCAELEGAEWVWVGMSPLISTKACICYGTSLAVDPHGRVFVPDKIACRVAVLDTNGNLIRYVGSYGNLDSRGPGSPIPDPEIAFTAVRMVVAATDRQLRVADNGTSCVSVISLDYAAESKVPVHIE